jgi:hypothetical protein
MVIYALKNSINSGSISIITQDHSLNSTLPLPFNSHLVDSLDNNDQQSLKNYLIPFP